jgi:hypothetical protein
LKTRSPLIIPLVVVGALLLPAAPPAQAADMRVKILPRDGKPRLKPAKRLRVVVTCSKVCVAEANAVLKMPGRSSKAKKLRVLKAGARWTLTLDLTRRTTRYLKQNARRSRLVVRVRTGDPETQRITSTSRTFRFRSGP